MTNRAILHPRRLVTCAALTAAAIVPVACGAERPATATLAATRVAEARVHAATRPAPALPSTPAGTQARWVLGALAHLPIPAAEIRAHVAPSVLAQVSPAALNRALTEVVGHGTVRLVAIAVSRPRALELRIVARGRSLGMIVAVNARGLITGLRFVPAGGTPSTPGSWSAVDARLRSVAPEVRMVAARVDGDACVPVHGIDPASTAPLGSAFKLYVLDALGRAIAAHRLGWSTRLTITAALKSLPSGTLQNDPDGTRISVLDAAAHMISVSDNTAANLLIAKLGRQTIEGDLRGAGMADPARNVPFLDTRELFILKLRDWPTLANRYLHADPAARAALLASSVDHDPLPSASAISSWTSPRDIDSLEWFASPEDICRAYASLASLARRPGLAPIAKVLSINDGGLGLDRRQWSATWFKGGSEPGVLTLSYLARTRAGRTYVVSALAENPHAAIDEDTAIPAMQSAIRGAFTLAAR